MNAKDLIQVNNQKRELLSEENKTYYENMLLYVRGSLRLSEQRSEEVLMEMLDHLLDAQRDGKTAEEVFGEDSRTYCKTVVEQLPKENIKASTVFLIYLGLQLVGFMLTANGVLSMILGGYDYKETVFAGSMGLRAGSVIVLTAILIFLVFAWLKRPEQKGWRKYVFPISCGFGIAAVLVLTMLLIPRELGYRFGIPSWMILLGGLLLLGSAMVLNRRFRITK